MILILPEWSVLRTNGGFAVLVGTIRKIENSMGDGAIRMYEKEIPIALILRAHVPWESSSIE